MGSTAPSPLYPAYIERLDLSHAMGTAIFSIYAAGTLCALFLTARLAAHVSDLRRLIVPGLILIAVGAVIFASGDSLSALLVGRFLNGFGTGLVTGMATTALIDLAPDTGRRMAATVATLAFTAGGAGGPLASSAALAAGLAPTVTPFILIVAIALAAIAGLVTCAWPTATARARATQDEAARDEAARDEAAQAEGCARDTTQMPLFLLACLTVGTAWMSGSILMAIGADLGTDLFGLRSASIAGLIPVLFQLLAGTGQALWGRARPRNAIAAGLTGMVAAQVALVAAAPGAHGFAMLATVPLCGLFYGAAFVGALGLASTSVAADKRGRFISTFYVVGYLSNAIPTVLVGVLTDVAGLGPAFYVFSGVLMALAATGAGLALRLGRSA